MNPEEREAAPMATLAASVAETPTERRMSNLVRGNEIRLARVGLKRRIAAGRLTVAEVLADVPSEARGWEIGQLLAAQRRWGPERVRKLLAKLEISETKQLGALTERQRRLLAASPERQLSAIDASVLDALAPTGGPAFAADIGTEVGLSSRSAATRLKALQIRGMVRADTGRPCGWLLTDSGRRELARRPLRPLSEMALDVDALAGLAAR